MLKATNFNTINVMVVLKSINILGEKLRDGHVGITDGTGTVGPERRYRFREYRFVLLARAHKSWKRMSVNL
jgi:hypothetical protein